MHKFEPVAVSIVGGVIAFIVFIVGIVWAVNTSTNRYYDNANKCIEAGNQFLPMGTGSYNGFCIKGSKQ